MFSLNKMNGYNPVISQNINHPHMRPVSPAIPYQMDRNIGAHFDYLMNIVNMQDGMIRQMSDKMEKDRYSMVKENEGLRNIIRTMEERIDKMERDFEEHKKMVVMKRKPRKEGKYIPPPLRIKEREEAADKPKKEQSELDRLWGVSDDASSGKGTPLYVSFEGKKSIW